MHLHESRGATRAIFAPRLLFGSYRSLSCSAYEAFSAVIIRPEQRGDGQSQQQDRTDNARAYIPRLLLRTQHSARHRAQERIKISATNMGPSFSAPHFYLAWRKALSFSLARYQPLRAQSELWRN